MADREPLHAASMTVVSCEHGTVHLRMHDNAGEIIAVGSMMPVVANDLVSQILEELEQFVARTAQPVGRA